MIKANNKDDESYSLLFTGYSLLFAGYSLLFAGYYRKEALNDVGNWGHRSHSHISADEHLFSWRDHTITHDLQFRELLTC